MTTAHLEPTLQDLPDGPGPLTEANDGQIMQWRAADGRFVMIALPRPSTVMMSAGGSGNAPAPTGAHDHDGTYVLLADYTGSNILAKLLDVDGDGSGLDADTLDGHDTDYFATAGHTHAAGDADTLDGLDSTDFALAGHNHDAAYAPLVHVHAGEDITSGTVAEARIDAAITRDTEVFGIVLAADGTGSGLDADLLDGVEGAGYALAGHDHSATYQPLDAELAAIAGLTSAADRVPYFTGSGTAALATLTTFGRSLIDDAAASDARTTLGLVIGTNVQAQDAELAALAGLTSAADRLPYFTGSGTASLATFTTAGRNLIDDASVSAQRTTLGLIIGTDVQAFDAELAAIAGLTSAADKLPYFTGSGTASLADLTTFGRSLIDDAAASNARTTLGLGTIATEAETNYLLASGARALSGDWDIGSGRKISGGIYAARSASGLRLEDDGGNLGMFIQDGGRNIGMGTASPSGVTGGQLLHVYGDGVAGEFIVQRSDGATIKFLAGASSGRVGIASNHPLQIDTNNTERVRIDENGLVGINVTSPQGILHGHDGTGGSLFVTKTAIAGTAVTIIPNGTGDVVRGVRLTGVSYASDGTFNSFSGGAANGAAFVVTVHGGTDGFTFTVAANGELSVARTTGSLTYAITLHAVWL